MWIIPSVTLFQEVVLGQQAQESKGRSTMTSLLRVMRLLRILRLVRLVRTIKPLYNLLFGIFESLKAMQWVLLLTVLLLYAGGIFWTSILGKSDLLQSDDEEKK